MPVKKVGSKWEVNGQEYDSEAKANAAYQATLALKFDLPTEKGKKSKKSTKKKSKKEKNEQHEDDGDEDD